MVLETVSDIQDFDNVYVPASSSLGGRFRTGLAVLRRREPSLFRLSRFKFSFFGLVLAVKIVSVVVTVCFSRLRLSSLSLFSLLECL